MTVASEDEGRSWIRPVFAFLFLLTIVKGIRMPNRWSVTHYLFTYETGFMKRGLWGEMLRLAFGGWTAYYFCLAFVALAIFFAIIGCLWLACRRLPFSTETAAFCIVFAASPALAYFAHMIGYLEQIGYLTLMLALLVRRDFRARLAVTIGAALLLPAVHEASMLWVGCLTLLALVTGDAAPAARVRAVALVAAVWIAATASVIALGGVSRQRVERIRADRTAFFEFRPRQDAFQTLRVPLPDAMADMRVRWSDPEVRIDMVLSTLVFAPATIFLGLLAVRRARALEGGSTLSALALALTVGAIVAPLLLHIVAWDRHRWNGLAALNAGLAALMLLAATEPSSAPRPLLRNRGLAVALIVAIWSISSEPVFFDRYAPRHPPFTYHVQFLLEAIRHPDRNLWKPTE